MATPLTNLVPRAGPQGPSGTNLDISIVAGENLAIRDCVYISTGEPGKTAGSAYKTDADITKQSTLAFAIGFAMAAVTLGDSGTIRIAGILGGFTSLTIGRPQYISGTAGGITETAPTNSVLVGIAISTTEVLLNNRGSQNTVSGFGIKGYFAGGGTGADVGQVVTDKIIYATDTTAAVTTANISVARELATGISDSSTKGFISGGYAAGTGMSAVADKITFSTDVRLAVTTANLTGQRYGPAGISELVTKGYYIGGITNGTPIITSDKTTFSTEVNAAQTTANVPVANGASTGIQGGATKGYITGGTTGAYVATTNVITFSSDITAAATATNLTAIRGYATGVSNGQTAGYVSGGSSSTYMLVTDKLTFSSDVFAAMTTANLSIARNGVAGVSEGSTKGYCAGGSTSAGSMTATTDKIIYATDTSAATGSASLSLARSWPAGISDVGL